MDTKPAEKVKSFVPDERPYFVHRSWRKYMGKGGRPARRGRPFVTKYEAVTVLFNEYTTAFDVPRYAEEFNWSQEDVRALIRELDADGVFDLHKPRTEV